MPVGEHVDNQGRRYCIYASETHDRSDYRDGLGKARAFDEKYPTKKPRFWEAFYGVPFRYSTTVVFGSRTYRDGHLLPNDPVEFLGKPEKVQVKKLPRRVDVPQTLDIPKHSDRCVLELVKSLASKFKPEETPTDIYALLVGYYDEFWKYNPALADLGISSQKERGKVQRLATVFYRAIVQTQRNDFRIEIAEAVGNDYKSDKFEYLFNKARTYLVEVLRRSGATDEEIRQIKLLEPSAFR